MYSCMKTDIKDPISLMKVPFLPLVLIHCLMVNLVKDFWYVGILGYHKHRFRRMREDAVTCGFRWPRHRCVRCARITGLDAEQVDRLPDAMRYVPPDSIWSSSTSHITLTRAMIRDILARQKRKHRNCQSQSTLVA